LDEVRCMAMPLGPRWLSCLLAAPPLFGGPDSRARGHDPMWRMTTAVVLWMVPALPLGPRRGGFSRPVIRVSGVGWVAGVAALAPVAVA
jgi:hypothetical protein